MPVLHGTFKRLVLVCKYPLTGFRWRVFLLQNSFNTWHCCSYHNAPTDSLLSDCNGSLEVANWWWFPVFTGQQISDICALTDRFLYMLASFCLPLIILASFGMYGPLYLSAMGDLEVGGTCEPHQAISGHPLHARGVGVPMEIGPPLVSAKSATEAPNPAERGRNAPKSIKYSQLIPMFVNNVKGSITAPVTQHSINWLSSVPLAEKQICTDLLPFSVLPCLETQ